MKNLYEFLVCGILALFVGCQVMNAETKRALLVGISDYGNAMEDPHMWANISGANDVSLLAPLLDAQGFTVTRLVDGKATHEAIVAALDSMARVCHQGEMIYLHFSMHGQPFEDLNGDEEDGWDEALIPVDAEMHYAEGVYEGANHLLDDELESYFEAMRSALGTEGKLVVVLDACHSGTASRGDEEHVRGIREGFTRSGKEYVPDRTRETNDYFIIPSKEGQAPILIIEACRSYQVNKEVRDVETNTWYGSLSYYIAQAMKENVEVGSDIWVEAIRAGMGSNRKLRKQNVVVEKSERGV